MDDMSDPYSRLYHKIADEFPKIYDGPDLADFMRLLVAADQSYPTKAKWAGHTSRRALDRLVAAGLIEVDGARYTVKGMDKERAARSDHARLAAISRHARSNAPSNAGSNAHGNAQSMPSKEETSREETSRASARGPDAFEVYQQVTGSWPSSKVTPWLSSLVDDHDEEAVCDALVAVAGQDPTRATLLSRVRDHLAAEAHREAKEAEERRAAEEAEYQRRERARIAEQSDEERAATEARWKALKPQLGGLVKAMPGSTPREAA